MSLTHVSLLMYITHVQSANILCVFMFPSISHQIVYQAVWRELSLKGHNVTVVATDPLNDPSLTNLTEISVRHHYESLRQNQLKNVLGKDASIFEKTSNFFEFFDGFFENELNSTQLRPLIYDENKKFELILVECYPYVLYAFAGKFKAPVITISTVGALVSEHNNIGNPNHPVLYPEMFLSSHGRDISLWQKTESFFYGIWVLCFRHYSAMPRAQKAAEKVFGKNIPYLGDLEKRISMRFPNVDPLLYPPRANVPAIAEMGLMHLKPVKTLPKDLKQILDEAEEGVIYVSFGTNISTGDLDQTLVEIIIQALSELPYKVIWKWNSDHLPNKPLNVITRKWLPQQDLLAHPNIRTFITQGGLQSLEEAISNTVPLVAFPFFGDQPMNVQRIVDLGIGIGLDPKSVTAQELRDSIIEVSENCDYRKRVKKVRNIVFDKPMTGLEKAVWWSEYVIRHKGATHLRSPSADISWCNFLMLDVVLIFISTIVIFTFVSYMVLKCILKRNI